MDTKSRKKNTDNFHIDRQDFLFSYEDETRDIIIGKYNNNQFDPTVPDACLECSQYAERQTGRENEQQNEETSVLGEDDRNFTDDEQDMDYSNQQYMSEDDSDYYNSSLLMPINTHSSTIQPYIQYTFDNLKHLFTNYKIVRVPLYYYPFKNEFVESQYYIFYFDLDNPFIHQCPACFEKFYENKIYVLDNIIILCSKCYNQKNIIQSV